MADMRGTDDTAVHPPRPARIKDVAARAGVSQSLVSRLLNNDANLTVREDTRQAVLDAVRELDYVPDSTATALRKSRTNAIGLVLQHVTSPVFTEIVHGAQRAAADLGCVLLLIDADEVENGSPLFRALIRARRVDGLLLQGGYGSGDELLKQYASLVPSVIVNSAGTDQAAGVRLEDELAAQLATQHLIDFGHRDLVFVSGPPSLASDVRASGFTEALKRAGIPLSADSVLAGGWEAQEGFDAVQASLARGRRPTGYVVATSGAALGVLSALYQAGIRIPEDASVIGVHDPWFAPYLNPALSTVALPLFELGRRSVEQLMARVSGGRPEDIVIRDPAPQLIIRQSTRAV
jgi:LacI family transcriptional regulator